MRAGEQEKEAEEAEEKVEQRRAVGHAGHRDPDFLARARAAG